MHLDFAPEMKSTAGSSDKEKTYKLPCGNIVSISARYPQVVSLPGSTGTEAGEIRDESFQNILVTSRGNDLSSSRVVPN